MTLVVEDGTGLANANSYVSVTEADAYWAGMGADGTSWQALTTAQKEAALILATRYINNAGIFRYRGTRKSYEQRMEWPRTGAAERNGPAIPDTVVPWRVKDAVLAASLEATKGALEPRLKRGGKVVSSRVDAISVTYATDAPATDTLVAVDGLLGPLLRTGRDHDTAPFFSEPTTPLVTGIGDMDNR